MRLFSLDRDTYLMTRFDHDSCVLLISTCSDRAQTILFDSAMIGDVFTAGVHVDLFGVKKTLEIIDPIVSLELAAKETLIFKFDDDEE